MKISIRGTAFVDTSAVGRVQVERLRQGLVSEDNCTKYFDSELSSVGLSGGRVRLDFDRGTNQWQTVTHYECQRPISHAMLKKLVDSTIGQWSDGFGSDCFADIADEVGAVIDLSPVDNREAVDVIVESTDETETPTYGLLSAAVREGDLNRVRELIDKGADLEEESQGATPLYGAVISGHRDVALELIEAGADVHAVNCRQEDALLATALSNVLTDEDAAAIASKLLCHGVSAAGKRGDYSPLFMALHRKKSCLATLLQKHGAMD
ncbi:hypothetical protein GC176_19190 [bacterium]|nr:hypothetical protein [bacterium]